MKKYLLAWVAFFSFTINIALAASSKVIEYYNLGITNTKSGNYSVAIQNFKKSIAIDPNFEASYKGLAYIYNKKNDAASLRDVLIKLTAFEPKNQELYMAIGTSYAKSGLYDNAIQYYKRTLNLKPDYKEAKFNLNQAFLYKEDQILYKNVNKAAPSEKAPSSVYDLLEFKPGLYNDIVSKTQEILDFIWSDAEGKIFLKYLIDNKVSIVVQPNLNIANTAFQTKPIKKVSINIPQSDVYNFRNVNLSNRYRFISFYNLVHEMSHASKDAILINNEKLLNDNKNVSASLEEEMFASMIGYNITSRIFTGQGLSEQQTSIYARAFLRGLLQDNHRELPVYNNFANIIKPVGINPPYSYIYSDLAKLYKEIRNDPDIVKHTELESIVNN